jgi:predicted ester cyclase
MVASPGQGVPAGKAGNVMTCEQNREKERRIVKEVINQGKMEALDECLTGDFVYHGPGGVEVRGIPGYKQFTAALRSAYPDIHVTIEDILAEGDLVATRTFCTFTFTGKAGPDNPSGRRVSMAGSILDRFKNGKIAETWEQYDRLDLYQQLGILPVKLVL